MEKIMFSIRLEGAGVGDTVLSRAQELKMLTFGWQAVLGLPVTGPAASRCPAVTTHRDSALLETPTALRALSF